MRAAEATIAPETGTVRERAPFGRRPGKQVITGVAGGLADWLGFPAWGVRLAFIFLLPAVLGGTATFGLYAAAALLMPAAGRRRPGWDNLAALLRLGALWLVIGVTINLAVGKYVTQPAGPISSWLPIYVLALLALALVLREAGRPWEPQRDRIVVLCAAPFVLVSGALAFGIWLVPEVAWQRFLPIVPIVAGGALLVAAGSKAGTALLFPAVLSVAVCGPLIASGAQLQGGTGDETVRPRTVAEVPPQLQRAAGDLYIDLSKLEPSRELIVMRVGVGAGEVNLNLPHGMRVDIDARVGRGRIYDVALQGNSGFGSEGFDLTMNDRGLKAGLGPVRPPARNRLKLIADVGIGELRIGTPENQGGSIP